MSRIPPRECVISREMAQHYTVNNAQWFIAIRMADEFLDRQGGEFPDEYVNYVTEHWYDNVYDVTEGATPSGGHTFLGQEPALFEDWLASRRDDPYETDLIYELERVS